LHQLRNVILASIAAEVRIRLQAVVDEAV